MVNKIHCRVVVTFSLALLSLVRFLLFDLQGNIIKLLYQPCEDHKLMSLYILCMSVPVFLSHGTHTTLFMDPVNFITGRGCSTEKWGEEHT